MSGVRSRRAAREAALRAIYAKLAGQEEFDTALAAAVEDLDLAPESVEFAHQIAEGVWRNQEHLEAEFTPFLASGWTVSRLAVIDRALLNMATWELHNLTGIPPKVTITEAIRLNKRYGSGETTGFVNAVLGKVLAQSPKANWDPSMEEAMEPDTIVEAEVVVEEIEEGTPEHEEIVKAGPWVIRAEE